MIKLSAEVLTAIEKTKPTCIATADKNGVPNLVYVTYIKAVDEKTLVVADNKFVKTRANLDSNPVMSVVVLDSDTKKAYQIKCTAECITEGIGYEEVADWVHENRPEMTPNAAFYLKPFEIYCGAERLA